MSWIDDFEHNSIWSEAETVDIFLSELAGQGANHENDRLQMLRELIARVLAQRADPNITITARSLGLVAQKLGEIRNSFPDINVAFKPERVSSGHASPLFDQIANEVRSWPQTGTGELSEMAYRANQMEQSTSEVLARARGRLEELDRQAARIQEQLQKGPSDQAREIMRVLSTAEGQIDAFQHEIAQLVQAGRHNSERVDETIRAQQDMFAQAERQRAEEATEAAQARLADWQEKLSRAGQDADIHIAQLEKHEEQSRNVLAAVGVNATATHYGSYAKEQSNSANRWRIGAALILALAGLWFVASSIFPNLHGEGALWEQAVSRLSITAAVAGVGLYAARESSQHRAQERRARRVELVLTALNPFIANLEEERAQNIRDEAARALFVSEPPEVRHDGASTDYLALIGELAQKIPAQSSGRDV
jgi:hypothetical protein